MSANAEAGAEGVDSTDVGTGEAVADERIKAGFNRSIESLKHQSKRLKTEKTCIRCL